MARQALPGVVNGGAVQAQQHLFVIRAGLKVKSPVGADEKRLVGRDLDALPIKVEHRLPLRGQHQKVIAVQAVAIGINAEVRPEAMPHLEQRHAPACKHVQPAVKNPSVVDPQPIGVKDLAYLLPRVVDVVRVHKPVLLERHLFK
ncbi:hypothetical protein D3C71_1353760 [compost metagenome]